MRALVLALALGAAAAAPSAAAPHGPGAPPGSFGYGTPPPAGPPAGTPAAAPPGTAPGPAKAGPSRPGGSGSSPSTGSAGGTAASGQPDSKASRARSGRSSSSAAAETGLDIDAFALSSWEAWWALQKDALLRDAAGPASVTRSAGLLAGRGRSAAGDLALPLPRARVATALTALLERETDAELCDSICLALGRVAEAAEAPAAQQALRRKLGHSALSVRTAATLGLGILGRRDAIPLLGALMADSPTGRAALGGEAAPWQIRAYAALSLGLLGDPLAAPHLLEIAQSSPGSDRELRVAAVVSLGLIEPLEREIAEGLAALLHDGREDPLVRCHAAAALARQGEASLLPRFIELLSDRRTEPPLRGSLALAVGRLGTPEQGPVLDALAAVVARETDASTRRDAMAALARIGGRGGESEAAAEGRRRIGGLLRREIADPGRSGDRPYAMLAGAIFGASRAEARVPIVDVLRSAYERTSDPSLRAAAALSLGMLSAQEAAPGLLADFRASRDSHFRGYAAVGLGLLRQRELAPELLALCRDEAAPEGLRLQAVSALGLMQDRALTGSLLETLAGARSIDAAWSLSRALGETRDAQAVEPLLRIAEDASLSVPARAFACVALGLIADRADLRFNTAIQQDLNLEARTAVIEEVVSF